MAYRHLNMRSMSLYAVVMLAAYTTTLFMPVGWGTYALALPAYIIIGLTCLSRANNLDEDTKVEDARRFGFAIMGGLMLLNVCEPIYGTFPKWPRVWGCWALAIIWMTTKGLPPWWEMVSGAWTHHGALHRAKLFLRSLHGSNKP